MEFLWVSDIKKFEKFEERLNRSNNSPMTGSWCCRAAPNIRVISRPWSCPSPQHIHCCQRIETYIITGPIQAHHAICLYEQPACQDLSKKVDCRKSKVIGPKGTEIPENPNCFACRGMSTLKPIGPSEDLRSLTVQFLASVCVQRPAVFITAKPTLPGDCFWLT